MLVGLDKIEWLTSMFTYFDMYMVPKMCLGFPCDVHVHSFMSACSGMHIYFKVQAIRNSDDQFLHL